jgi:glutamyl-tRNA synthetase
MQQALGFRRPAYAHVSTITNPDRSKMSKRDKDKALRSAVQERRLDAPPPDPGHDEPVISPEHWSWWQADRDHQLELDAAVRLARALQVRLPEINVEDFRRSGYLPEVLANYLALLGWSPGGDVEKFDGRFLQEHFDLDRLIKSAAAFDREKLLAFNLDAIQAMPPEAFVERFREHCREHHREFLEHLGPEQFDLLARANQGRSKTLEDPIESCRFFLLDDDQVHVEPTKAVRKALGGGPPSGCDHLEAVLPVLEAVEPWTVAALESAVSAYVDEHAGGKLGRVAQSLRVAMSGGTVSPAIFETLVILGRASVLNRIRRCLDQRPA